MIGTTNRKWVVAPAALALTTLIGFAGYRYQICKPERLNEPRPLPARQLTTEEYIANFDPRAYEWAGTDYFNERYRPSRLNKPLPEIDITFDYDFALLNNTFDRLRGVERRAALKAIFGRITAGSTSHTERHLALLKFLHKAAHHNVWVQPMHEDKQGVFDPIVLLELGEMRCGAVARLASDLFESAGYEARIVQAAMHQSAEVFYDGRWHLVEADLAGGGQAVMIDGEIPSLEELSGTPFLIDRVPTHFEGCVAPKRDSGATCPTGPTAATYPSYFFFSEEALGALEAAYYYKTATKEQAEASKWYGWNYYRTESNRWKLSDIERKYEPGPPVFQHVVIKSRKATIGWAPASDPDADLLGYRVYVSRNTRGWNHEVFTGNDGVKPYFRGGWKPEMYDAMFREPPRDVGLVTTDTTSVVIDLPPGETRYVTVMPFDEHGESVGRTLYNMSEELTLSGDREE